MKFLTVSCFTCYVNNKTPRYCLFFNYRLWNGFKGKECRIFPSHASSLVIEVLSPSTSRNDRIKKYNAYQKFGVNEYWIVDPLNETVEVYVLDEGTYRRWNAYGREDLIHSKQFESIEFTGEEMFSYDE